MDDTGDIMLDQRYADADVWCEWAFILNFALFDKSGYSYASLECALLCAIGLDVESRLDLHVEFARVREASW